MVFLIAGSVLLCLIILAVFSIKFLFRQQPSSIELDTLSNQSSLDVIKKYELTKIAKKRGILLLSGLLIAMTFSTILIEYKTEVIHQHIFEEKKVWVDKTPIYVPQTRIKPPEPPKKVTPIIQEVDDIDLIVDDVKIDDIDDPIDIDDDIPEEPMDDIAIFDEPITEDPVMDGWAVAQKPEFPGGISALQAYVVSHFNLPYREYETGTKGRIYVEFIVEKDGSISGVQVKRGLSKLMDKEAKRVIKSLPKWNPGINDIGAPVRVRYIFPISIQ